MSQTASYDAIVVGAGATGGVAARQLTEAGLTVLALDSGGPLKRGAYGTQATNLARQLTRHFVTKHQRTQEMHGGYWESHPDLFIDDEKNPYTTPEGKPYLWIRGGRLGGRSHTWGGVTLRFSDYEFKSSRHDGHGTDWPIGHDDLAPFYDDLERHLAVHGARDGVAALPDGSFLEPSPLSSAELSFKGVVEQRFDGRRVVASRGIRAARHAEKGEQFSRLSSLGSTLIAAAATGRLTLTPDALVARLVIDDVTGRARGVEWIDRTTRALHSAHARIVVLCASTLESLRILMATTSKAHPNGVGASSGLLGRGLMDHIVSTVYFVMPEHTDQAGFPLLGSDSIVIPRWQNLGRQSEKYLRGFGMWGGIGRMPFPPFLKKTRGAALGFLCAMGEALPHDDNHMRLDTEVKDAWGLPVPHISCAWTENDVAVCSAGRAAAIEMVEAAGGVVGKLTDFVRTPLLTPFMMRMDEEWKQTTPGLFVHEVGGARMGTDPKTSVTNPTCQVWDAPNVVLGDGAPWVSSGWQNPTLTEMAICARACTAAVDQLKRGEL